MEAEVPQQGRLTESAPPPSTSTTKRFTALLDAETDGRYTRVLAQLRDQLGPIATREDGHGRTRAGYDISRADLLRALLAVADKDPDVLASIGDHLRRHYVVVS